MQKPALKYLTPEEYLAMEEVSAIRHEYYQGEIFAMAGATNDHNLIAGDVHTRMNLALTEKGCLVYMTDMQLWVQADRLMTYPDVMVVCGDPKFYEDRTDVITNPIMIVEVLSKSSKDYDRGDKFRLYQSIPTLQEYILIDQYTIYVEQYYLETPKKWAVREFNRLTEILQFAKIDFQISLQDIYRRVKFAKGMVHGA